MQQSIHDHTGVVIFDFDGTLFDSMPFWDNLALSGLTELGLEPAPELLDHLPEMTMREVAEYMALHHPQLGSADEIERAWKRMARRAFQHELPFKPGALELMADLKKRGKRIAIATMSEREMVRLALARHDLESILETLVTFEDVGIGKHEPAIWLEITRQLETVPESCTVIEDAYFAARTAKFAGFRVIGVAESANDSYAANLQALADLYVTSLSDLIGKL